MTLAAALLQVAEEHPTPALLDPKAGLFFFTVVVFVIVALLLRKYAWGPITSALETREKTIEESINRAEKALAEARQISEDNEKARREAEFEAQRVMREAREAAEALRAEEVGKTRDQVRQMQESAREEIEREKEGALNELRAEVARLAVNAAEKLLEENLDADKNRRLVQSFLDDMSEPQAQ
ncbi:MAG: F0F1 ATP synthase subunit B [Candidatus Latescibacterota bacterium]|jgi:F-type H+-transporting ATPase subunit b